MAFTYDDSLPTEKDVARAALGDTNMDAPIFSDEHITAVITLAGSVEAGVAALARELIATYAHQPVQKSAYGISVDYSDRIAVWQSIVSSSASGGIARVSCRQPARRWLRAYAAGDEFAR